jgi:CRP-like cAMP-binding protein
MRVLGQGTAAGDEEAWLLSCLRGIDLFASLSDEQLRKVLYFVKTVEFDEGETVFETGDTGDSFYLIFAGCVETRVSGWLKAKVLRRMGPGEFFGELALILGQPRSADIVCVEPTVCFVLDRADLQTLMERAPDIADAVKKIAKDRFEHSP